ncbi:uncharacterized protein TNCV_845941 [Trichonephila clavipes]|nr:uncharacterized protein TNCV_845941 [Trichonephila clavipes]
MEISLQRRPEENTCWYEVFRKEKYKPESAARPRMQLNQYECWDSDSVSAYDRDPESNYQCYRSNTPYHRRNPQRHQLRSPSRRSHVRTSEEN